MGIIVDTYSPTIFGCSFVGTWGNFNLCEGKRNLGALMIVEILGF